MIDRGIGIIIFQEFKLRPKGLKFYGIGSLDGDMRPLFKIDKYRDSMKTVSRHILLRQDMTADD